MRRRLLPAITGATVLATVLSAPAAMADDDPSAPVLPTVTGVGSVAGDPGRLELTAASDTDITELKATLTPKDGGEATTVETVAFERVSGEAGNGTWRTKDRLDLPAYAYYDVSVDAADADGDHPAAPGTGWLNYQKWPVFQNTSITPTTLDFSHRTVTATGTVVTLDPRTGEVTEPWAGQTVELSGAPYGPSATTAADGSYTIKGPFKEYVGSAKLSVLAAVPYGPVGNRVASPATDVAQTRHKVRITLDNTAVKVNYGKTFKVSGLAEYLVDGAWQPLPKSRIEAGDEYPDRYATTNAGGRFSFSGLSAGDDTKLSIHTPDSSYDADPYLGTGKASVKVNVINKITVCYCSSWLTEESTLHVGGSIQSSNYKLPKSADRKVYLQQSANGKTGWKSLGWIKADKYGNFDVDGYVEVPRGYWRLYYPGAADYQAAYSNKVHYSRIDTRFTKFNASPEPVRKGKTIKVSGKLQKQPSKAWKNFSGQKVYIVFNAKGSSKYTLVAEAKTNKSGNFSTGVTAKKDGTYTAVWLTPNGKYVHAQSKGDYVNVK